MSVAEALDAAFYLMIRRWRELLPVWLMSLAANQAERGFVGLLDGMVPPPVVFVAAMLFGFALATYVSAVSICVGADLFLLGVSSLRHALARASLRYFARLVVGIATTIALLVGFGCVAGLMALGSPTLALEVVLLELFALSGILVIFVAAILVFIGYFGFFWYVGWALAADVALVEGAGVRASLARSRRLIKGSRPRLWPALLGAVVFPFIASEPITWVFPEGWIERLAVDVATAGTMLFVELFSLALYFDLRCRAEAFDLEALAAAVDSRAPISDVAP
jgi:hypothetical protein